MKKISKITTNTYKFDETYLVDIVHNEEDEFYEAWLYNKNCEQKLAVYTIPTNNIEFKEMKLTESAFVALVENQLKSQPLIEMYKELYED
ncbi:hypothetical protein SAMN04487761_11926 [Lachnospiraceae bacterium C7]|nr:hypothetical protein SAMN04487761_11926 [Lachnospiraceae bacterium C7]